jgi:hypothetical protein
MGKERNLEIITSFADNLAKSVGAFFIHMLAIYAVTALASIAVIAFVARKLWPSGSMERERVPVHTSH